LRPQKAILVHDEQLAILAEGKIGCSIFHKNLAQQNTTCGPDVDAIPASSIDIPEYVVLNSVGDASVCHGEDTAVSQEGVSVPRGDVEGVARKTRWYTVSGILSQPKGIHAEILKKEDLHGCWFQIIYGSVTVHLGSIGDVQDALIG